MRHLSEIARETGTSLDELRLLESLNRFQPTGADSNGRLYDEQEVVAAVRKSRQATAPEAPLLHFGRLVWAVSYVCDARSDRAVRIRAEAIKHVLNVNTTETVADAAKRLGIRREYFSTITSRVRVLTGMN